MLFGKYYHTLDDKNRLMLPKKMKESLTGNLYLIRGYDGCLSIYKEVDFLEYVNKISSLSYTKQETRHVARLGYSSVNELKLDKAGRIQLPQQIINEFSIGKEVVVVGVFNHLEIWDKKTWDEYENNNKDKFEQISEALPL